MPIERPQRAPLRTWGVRQIPAPAEARRYLDAGPEVRHRPSQGAPGRTRFTCGKRTTRPVARRYPSYTAITYAAPRIQANIPKITTKTHVAQDRGFIFISPMRK